jgi:hypothetical protein
MEQKLKIIKLIESSKISSKKQLYKDILSSSKKVQDIIKKTKINTNKYYRSKNEHKIEFNEPIVEFNEPIVEFNEPIVELNEPIVEFNKNKSPKIFEPKKTKCNKKHFIKFDKINKKTLKKLPITNYKSKKINISCVPSLKYVNNCKKQTIRLFTNSEINKFINVLTYYGEYEQFNNIHKYIKKLNKYQTNQILQNLTLINRKSNAPNKMLKNILYNYFCCNLIITR